MLTCVLKKLVCHTGWGLIPALFHNLVGKNASIYKRSFAPTRGRQEVSKNPPRADEYRNPKQTLMTKILML